MKIHIKITVGVVSAFAFVVTGYCFGLVVQHKRDSRVEAAIELEQAMKLHKALSVGNYAYAQWDAKCRISDSLLHLDSSLEFDSLPVLFRESLSAEYDTGWHRASLARIIGMHRVKPDFKFPAEMQAELTAFVPHTGSEQHALDSYAQWYPVGY